MPEPESWRAVVTDEGDVGRAEDAHDPRLGAFVAHALDECGEDVTMLQSVDRLRTGVRTPKAGPTAITTSSGRVPFSASAGLLDGALASLRRAEQARIDRRTAAVAVAATARPPGDSPFPGRGSGSGR